MLKTSASFPTAFFSSSELVMGYLGVSVRLYTTYWSGSNDQQLLLTKAERGDRVKIKGHKFSSYVICFENCNFFKNIRPSIIYNYYTKYIR